MHFMSVWTWTGSCLFLCTMAVGSLATAATTSATASSTATVASIISTSTSNSAAESARLPLSLSKVVADLECYDGSLQIATGCFIPSRSVSRDQRMAILERLLDAPIDKSTFDTWRAVATSSGLVLMQPNRHNCYETVAAAACCDNTIFFYPSMTDIQRGEGLLDSLAPVIERLQAKSSSDEASSSTLYVLLDSDANMSMARRALEDASAAILGTPLSTVFTVVYATPETVMASMAVSKPSQVMARVTQVEAETGSNVATTLAPMDLAVVQTLAPLARSQVEQALGLIKDACTDENGSTKLVVGFGALVDAVVKQAIVQFDDAASTTAVAQSAMSKQVKSSFLADLEVSLSEPFATQLALLRTASWEEFKRGLSKLLVSPNLQADMESVSSKATAALTKACHKLVPRSLASSSWTTDAVQIEFGRRVKQYVSNRILTARASGKFRPLPRKGVTVGLHWLLPKPFGNDYRQEPWMVHATDNMVYVPRHKLADVNPDDVATGDWRDKIVPSPSGNDMLYMQ